MCGIYGMAKQPNQQSKKQLKKAQRVLKEIAIKSEQRGQDSSGLAVVGEVESQIHKSLLKSSKFVNSKEWTNSMKSLPSRHIYLGHTRFATSGEISIENAHPFKVGRTIGAHNGCLSNMYSLKTKLDKVCEVDSQLIFKAIDSTENIQTAVDYLRGDFALSFVKDTYNILYLCRELNRPLSVAYWKEARILFYASKEEFIEKALLKAGLSSVDVIDLEKNRLYAFDILKFDSKQTNVDKSDFEFESQRYYTFGSSVNYKYNHYNYYYNDSTGNNVSKAHARAYGNGTSTQYEQDGSIWETNNVSDDDYGERRIIDSNLLKDRYYQDYDDKNWFYDTLQRDWFYIDVDDRVISEKEFIKLKVSSPVFCNYCGVDMDFVDCDCYQQSLRLESETEKEDKENLCDGGFYE